MGPDRQLPCHDLMAFSLGWRRRFTGARTVMSLAPDRDADHLLGSWLEIE
jgi:hypothetical protein